ncbi:DNA polymerase [Caulobacter phage KcrB]|nr:DNA polymerase [Caulobacter phage RW]WCA46361.1 DNA polymerase [Caulobacter phage KcrB]
MNTLFLDLETFSTVPITHGTHAYAEKAEVLLIPHAWNDEPAVTWDATEEGCDPRAMLQSLIDQADEVVIHNSHFDRTVMRWQGVDLSVKKVHDTMVRAMLHSLPGSLGQLCDIIGVPTDKAKDKDGKRLIHLFTKPLGKNRKLDRATRETHPEDWEKFKEYARLDVEAMRELYKRLPRWNYTPSEVALWRLDQRINDRGVAVDLDLAHAALRAAKRAGESLAARAKELTDGAVPSATQRNVLLEHLEQEHGFTTPDLKKGTVAALLKEGELPDGVRELLEVRQQAAATSPAKYKVLVNATSSDGRLRGIIQFCGALRTSRFSGKVFQPQNLPRPTLKQAQIDFGIAAMKSDSEDLFFDNVMELCASAVRGSLIAPPGKKMVIADLSNIEGRVLAWLAGETWKIKAFGDYDRGIGHDIYVLAYSRAFGVAVEDVLENKKSGDGSMRQLGKVMELSCGFQGGVGAFSAMGALYGVTLPEDEALATVKAWRAAHPATVRLWYDLERACRAAIQNEGHIFRVRDLAVRRDGPWLRIRLPSGRYLCYPHPKTDEDGRLSYMGANQYTRKWEEIPTYSGKLCIAKFTPVLTSRGWIPIQDVSTRDHIWDGCEWVRHAGLSNNGVKPVVRAHGVWMTEDHELLTTEGWKNASQSEGLDRFPVRLPDGHALSRVASRQVDMDRDLRLRQGKRDGSVRTRQAAEERNHSVLRMYAAQNAERAQEESWHVADAAIRGVSLDAGAMQQPQPRGVSPLWWARHKGVRALVVLREFLGGHGRRLRAWADTRPHRQRRKLLAGKLSLGDVRGAGAQQEHQCSHRYAMGPHDNRGGVGTLWDRRDDASVPPVAGSKPDRSVLRAGQHAEVLDILNCGPRNRFVVMDCDGNPLIVHNCENVVQAVARDVLASGLHAAETNGYLTVLHVHDELITETPDTDEYSAEKLAALMATNPQWSAGLPLAAAGFETYRYRKD